MFGFALILLIPFPAKLLAQGCELEPGGPSCGAESDPGSSNTGSLPQRHVGNPVDVITGNKYQRVDDYRALGSPLIFSRHYNTALVDHDVRLGQGWRHSYSVVLSRVDENTLQIVQSDGRVIRFVQSVVEQSTDAQFDRFLAASENDGYINLAEQAIWYLPDGRRFTFRGSFLVRIDYPRGEYLFLRYSGSRLVSVTDNFRREIQIRYTPGPMGLAQYDPVGDITLPGHIESVVLPNGAVIAYRYDGIRNLTSASYPSSSLQKARYSDQNFPHHLTGFTEQPEYGFRTWQYDYLGRGVRYEEPAEGETLRIEYFSEGEQPTSGETLISWDSGRQARYFWRRDTTINRYRVSRLVERLCVDCAEVEVDYEVLAETQTLTDAETTTPSTASAVIDSGTASTDQAPTDVYQRLGTLASSFEPDTTGFGGTLQGESIGLSGSWHVEADRLGSVTDIAVEDTSLQELLRSASTGELESCGTDGPIEQLVRRSNQRCLEDLLILMELQDQIETNLGSGTSAGYSTRSLQSRAGNRFCALPEGRSCAQLERDYEMAHLSNCSYSDNPCGRGWQRVDPREVSLTQRDFSGNQFFASLYQNELTGEYVLAFRGTDQFRDIDDSLSQYAGLNSNQYQRASDLARTFAINNPGVRISYTGHSLGGGLASIAALSSGAEATVFNAAAIHPDAVANLDLNYQDAESLVDALNVDGDGLTRWQESPPPEGPTIGSDEYYELSREPPNPRYPAAGSHATLVQPDAGWIDHERSVSSILVWPKQILLHRMSAVEYSIRSSLIFGCGIHP